MKSSQRDRRYFKRIDLLILPLLLLLIFAAYYIPHWRAPLAGHVIQTIVAIEDEIWIGTDKGAYRVFNNKPIPILEGMLASEFTEFQGEVWVATSQGAFRVVEGRAQPVFQNAPVNTMADIRGQIWLATPQSLYRLDPQGHPQPMLKRGEKVRSVSLIKEVQGQIWLAAPQGAYRVIGDEIKPGNRSGCQN